MGDKRTKYCCKRCRLRAVYAAKKKKGTADAHKRINCAGGCGALVWMRKDGHAATCLECRALETQSKRALIVCEVCGRPRDPHHSKRFCSRKCAAENRARSIPTEWTAKTRRRYREAVTPGLSSGELRALARRYIETGAVCAYCPAPATTVDHVFPMSRGGTSHEGNIVPCCKSCNSSKADLLLIEWRMGKPHGRTWMDRPWMDAEMPRLTRPEKGSGKPRKVTNPHRFRMLCPCCVTSFVPERVRSTCGLQECVNEYTARVQRDKYRARNGLEPKGLDYPTKPWMRKHVIPYAASM
jgi:hypothetical protein